MTREYNTNTQFEKLSAEIARDEQALHDVFTTTPSLEPASLQRIKDRLHLEIVAMRSARAGGSAWLRCVAAAAATLLVALGVRFYAMTSHGIVDLGDLVQTSGSNGPDTAIAAVPATLADEDKELDQLRSELWQLEMQAASDTTDPGEGGDPAADRDWPDMARSKQA